MNYFIYFTSTPNIIGCYMLRLFAHPVACCWAKFETGHTFSPVQTDATLLANNSHHCCANIFGSCCVRLHVALVIQLDLH